jgi:hypothetical protein
VAWTRNALMCGAFVSIDDGIEDTGLVFLQSVGHGNEVVCFQSNLLEIRVVYSDPGGDDVLVSDLLHSFSSLKSTFILRGKRMSSLSCACA